MTPRKVQPSLGAGAVHGGPRHGLALGWGSRAAVAVAGAPPLVGELRAVDLIVVHLGFGRRQFAHAGDATP